MTHFVRNNIRYRSASAKALEGFYNSKAFILNETISSKHGISETAREVLLLMFNTHNNVLYFVENQFLDKDVILADDTNIIGNELRKSFKGICEIFDKHIDIFDSNFIRHWIKIHQQLLFAFYHSIDCAAGKPPILAFSFITESLIAYLNATMFELFELDCLLGSNIVKRKVTSNQSFPDGLILYMDDLTQTYEDQTGVCSEVERLLYYVETLISVESFNIEVRDYSNRYEDTVGGTKASSNLLQKLKSFPFVKDVDLIKKVSA